MIGLVLVSHSARLADGARELAAQVAGANLRIGVAAGLDLPDRPLGTDAALVARVIDEVWSEDGVLVLMDLGSAVLSAEMALELLPEERRGRVLLTAAPFVEGAVAAAVAAANGAPLEDVAREACGGLAGKVAHLAPGQAPSPAATPPAATPVPAGGPVRGLRLTIDLPQGLHARPAAALVRTAAAYDAVVTVADVTSGRGPVSARSLNAVATLGVLRGHDVLVEASGPQAAEVLAAIGRLAGERFGEAAQDTRAFRPVGGAEESSAQGGALDETAAAAAPPGSVLQGLPASPGIAIGAARKLHAAPLTIADAPAADAAAEAGALARALEATAADVRSSRAAVSGRAAPAEAAIFDAHLLFLDDEALLEPARRRIDEDGVTAARAWADAVAAAAARWDALADPYQRARAADVRSVGEQVLRHLLGVGATAVVGGEGIVVAADLSPAETAALDRSLVRGVACAHGGPASHAVILARALGIPAVVGAGPSLLLVEEGTTLAVDGEAGTVAVDPPAAAVRAARVRQGEWVLRDAEARLRASSTAVTRDGVTVRVTANIAAPAEVAAALASGAEGVGLLRTEFLFLSGDHLPTEEEQEHVYRDIAEALGGRPLTLRTLDAGADKQLPALPRRAEANPFLGVRGLRLSLRYPEIFRAQLRAALRVAADHPLRVMFPMVATVDELLLAKKAVKDALTSLLADGAETPADVELGIMVEVPSAALLADAFAAHVDFFSVGTNDLTQYVLAADRGNADLATLADALHPAVLLLIARTVQAAGAAGRWVAVCGELAADPVAIPILIGLGVRELSMAAAGVPAAKQVVRETSLGAAAELARAALSAQSAEEVRRLAQLSPPAPRVQ